MYRTQALAPPATRPSTGLPDLPSLTEIEAAARVVYREFQATPQYRWGLSSQRLGTDCWIKHENHTPVGAFKIRGGLTYFDALSQAGTLPKEVISATRGNHGQSIGWAARAHGVACTIVVPRGNSLEKNAAMRALGVTLVEHGEDFQESREFAMRLATERGAHMVPSFHADLLSGVSTYWWEFMVAVPQLDVVYVPIGQGSGACSAIAAKLALGRKLRIVGVVSAHATTYADSLAAGRVVEAPVSTQLADGMACRIADPAALDILLPHLDHIVKVSDDEVAQAMRDLYADTHNIAEGAGAASFAAAMQERAQLEGQVVGTTLCGGNVDSATVAKVLSPHASRFA
ncbi:MAG: threonine dehydratase [Polaromonas sp.]|uniref:threonine dehydratase n=1 Tax=Polaromonas sp. TaxID=1869339 RepID=UPI002488251B|nr:threonine dehydratase [Polaromonas sp.]MDI1268520.1 threonine dehydratase [Polaromonas sp.]